MLFSVYFLCLYSVTMSFFILYVFNTYILISQTMGGQFFIFPSSSCQNGKTGERNFSLIKLEQKQDCYHTLIMPIRSLIRSMWILRLSWVQQLLYSSPLELLVDCCIDIDGLTVSPLQCQ